VNNILWKKTRDAIKRMKIQNKLNQRRFKKPFISPPWAARASPVRRGTFSFAGRWSPSATQSRYGNGATKMPFHPMAA
jgi:hypothetical protein